MKGGITSGVIYPRLISRLSQVYTLRSIGGTSAGAIAAAAAAAAQLGVSAGTNPGAFKTLEELPDFLEKAAVKGRSGSRLLRLFQPGPGLRRHFAVLTSALNARSKTGRVASILTSTLFRFPLGTLVGAVPGLILFLHSDAVGQWFSGAFLVIGALVGAVLASLLSLVRKLPKHRFGLCDGMSPEGLEPKALTPWLDGYLKELAGKTGGDPLTFGELWAGKLRGPDGKSPFQSGTPKRIELAMMTTALNLGRPFVLPFESNDIYFCEEDLRELFPKSVAAWMVTHARPSKTAPGLSRPKQTMHALPMSEDLPVLFAVRLSLSFPILLSAIPLYGVDRTLRENSGTATVATRLYFSDGGICSNFPIHFFDAPLPSRPTFGVNLRDFHPQHPDERVWLPEVLRNNQGLKNYIPPLDDAPGFGSVVGFLSAILETMQNWGDRMQLAMPGFRDRIVHVSHTADEGGLNLDMPDKVIQRLAGAGADAAELLVKAFEEPGSEGWPNHRRIRLRSLVGGVQQQLDALSRALARPDQPTWGAVALDAHPPSYPFPDPAECQGAKDLLDRLEAASQALKVKGINLDHDSPRPRPEWRATPRL
jgi:predicted acylesterase/phospholipase RssA